jgi:hypothetical protein
VAPGGSAANLDDGLLNSTAWAGSASPAKQAAQALHLWPRTCVAGRFVSRRTMLVADLMAVMP